MPVTLTKTAYTFAELSDEAKEKAIQWMRQKLHEWFDASNVEHIHDDFVEVAKRLGLEVGQKKPGNRPAIYWTGFWSQGDGACFEGRWSYKADALEKVKEYAPQDETLHRIATDLKDLWEKAGSPDDLGCEISHSGHYYHERSMSFDVWQGDGDDVADHTYEAIKETFADLARWLYAQLEAEYEYQTSDETAKERLEDSIDECLFDEDGSVTRF